MSSELKKIRFPLNVKVCGRDKSGELKVNFEQLVTDSDDMTQSLNTYMAEGSDTILMTGWYGSTTVVVWMRTDRVLHVDFLPTIAELNTTASRSYNTTFVYPCPESSEVEDAFGSVDVPAKGMPNVLEVPREAPNKRSRSKATGGSVDLGLQVAPKRSRPESTRAGVSLGLQAPKRSRPESTRAGVSLGLQAPKRSRLN